MSSKYDFLEHFVGVSKDGRIMRCRLAVEDLGVRDDMLLAASGEAAGVPLYHMCDMPNTDMKIHVYAATNIAMAVRMTSIRLNTWWTMVENDGIPMMVPNFQSDGSIDRALDWTPPKDCALYLVIRNSTPYLIALNIHPQRGNWRAMRIALPNVYNDSRVCMGREFVPPQTGSYVARLRHYLDSFHMTRWNTDLLAGEGQGLGDSSKKMVRFDLEGKVLPPAGHWTDHCKEVSHSAYNWLVSMAQARKEAP